MHDPTKVLLGATHSSSKFGVQAFSGDPAVLVAGLAVRLKTDGTLSLIKADGGWLGVSLGRSLSDTSKVAILAAGELVPMRMALKRASGSATITSYANLVSGTADTLTIGATVFTAQAGAATLGAGTFQAATSNDATATSLAAQINAHATAKTLVKAVAVGPLVSLVAVSAGAAGNDVAVVYVDNGSIGLTLAGLSGGKLAGGSAAPSDIAYAAKGTKAYINDATGEVDSSDFGTISDATIVSAPLTGITEAGTQVGAVLVDIPGGL